MKRAATLVAVLALIIGGALLLYPRLFPDEQQPFGHDAAAVGLPTTPDAAVATEDGGAEDAGTVVTRARVVDIRGVSQRRLADGRWETLKPGDSLALDDTIRTLSGGSVQVQLGNAVGVRLTSRTEVTIRELTERTSRVRIEEGRIVAEVNPAGKTVLRVEAKGTQAVAEASGGAFSMISDGRGQVAVATTAGEVKLVSAGQAVAVTAGQTAQVRGDQAPSAPSAIPSSLFLKVAAPTREIQRERETTVQGKATPGSLVRAGDQVAVADERGEFRIRVPLREGRNEIGVQVTDLEGREKHQTMAPITVDTREPTIENTEVQWGGD